MVKVMGFLGFNDGSVIPDNVGKLGVGELQFNAQFYKLTAKDIYPK